MELNFFFFGSLKATLELAQNSRKYDFEWNLSECRQSKHSEALNLLLN